MSAEYGTVKDEKPTTTTNTLNTFALITLGMEASNQRTHLFHTDLIKEPDEPDELRKIRLQWDLCG